VVSSRVADADAARLQALMDPSSVKIADRSAAYRKTGWTSFDPKATPYSPEQVRRERELYRRVRPPCWKRGHAYQPFEATPAPSRADTPSHPLR
jgi:hypothetical protein